MISSAAAAVKWLTVPGEAHVTEDGAGPSFVSLQCLCVGADRQKRSPRDEGTVQRLTKEFSPGGALPGRRERGGQGWNIYASLTSQSIKS